MRIFKNTRLGFFLLTSLIIIGVSEVQACAGAGMRQLFPLAQDAEGDIWYLSVSTIRHEFGTAFDFNAFLFRSGSDLTVKDSTFVYEHICDRNSVYQDRIEEIMELNPITSIDSIYTLGVKKLKSMGLELSWLHLLGFSSFGEHNDPIFSLNRTRLIQEIHETSKYRGRDTIRSWIDTTYELSGITIYDSTHSNFQMKSLSQGESDAELMGFVPRKMSIGSSRLYRMEKGGYIVVVHLNIMSHFQNTEHSSWVTCMQTADGICMEAKDQQLTWHHSGEDYIIRLGAGG